MYVLSRNQGEDGDDSLRNPNPNRCDLLWSGALARRLFTGFKFTESRNSAAAKKLLDGKGLVNTTICLYTYVCVLCMLCMYLCDFIYAKTTKFYVCMHVCMYVCMYVYVLYIIYVGMYVCVKGAGHFWELAQRIDDIRDSAKIL